MGAVGLLSGDLVTVFGLALVAALLITGIVVMLTRRSHLRNWRFGVFFESEERYGEPIVPDEDPHHHDQ